MWWHVGGAIFVFIGDGAFVWVALTLALLDNRHATAQKLEGLTDAAVHKDVAAFALGLITTTTFEAQVSTIRENLAKIWEADGATFFILFCFDTA